MRKDSYREFPKCWNSQKESKASQSRWEVRAVGLARSQAFPPAVGWVWPTLQHLVCLQPSAPPHAPALLEV